MNRLRHRQRGQSLAEFSLVLPVFLLVVFGIVQMGFLMGSQLGLTSGVREAARFAATTPTATEASVVSELRTRSLPRSIPGFADAQLDLSGSPARTRVEFCSQANANNVPGSYPSYSRKVRVIATYRHVLFVPLVSSVLDRIDGSADGALTTRVVEEMRVETSRLTSAGGLPAC